MSTTDPERQRAGEVAAKKRLFDRYADAVLRRKVAEIELRKATAEFEFASNAYLTMLAEERRAALSDGRDDAWVEQFKADRSAFKPGPTDALIDGRGGSHGAGTMSDQHADYVAAAPLDEAEKMESWQSIPTPSSASTAVAAAGVLSSRSAEPATGTVTSTAASTTTPASGERFGQRSVSAGHSSRHTPTEYCPRTHPILLECAVCLAEEYRRRAEMAECLLEEARRHIDGGAT